jgi:hypothetical protein
VVRPHPRIPSPAALVIPLREQSASAYAGIAWMEPNEDETTVTIFLAQGLVGQGPMAGGPAMTPAP